VVALTDAVLVLMQSVSPPPVPLVDFTTHDNGSGPQIVQWNTTRLGPQPTAQQLAAVTAAQVADYYAATNAPQPAPVMPGSASFTFAAEYKGVGARAQSVCQGVTAAVVGTYLAVCPQGVQGGALPLVGPGGSVTLYTDAQGNTLTLSISPSGAVTVQRTAGSAYFTVALSLLFI
jgi:hypothetical protein